MSEGPETGAAVAAVVRGEEEACFVEGILADAGIAHGRRPRAGGADVEIVVPAELLGLARARIRLVPDV